MPFLCLFLTVNALGADHESTSSATGDSQLSKRDALILGIVEGVTEFLPISSTGHLIITNRALGLDADQPLLDRDGFPLWVEVPSPENPGGRPLTLKIAADTYTVMIQVGAILAVVMVFHRSLMSVCRGLTGREPAGLRLLRNLALAFLPVMTVGLVFEGLISQYLFSVPTVIAALVVGALLMFAAEAWRKRRGPDRDAAKLPADLTPREAVQIGIMQCLALWPGMSRSMVTMVGGYVCGLAPARAAEFSFLVGLPVLGGAAVYKGLQTGPAMLQLFGWEEVLFGGFIAALSAAMAVRFLVAWLQKYGLEVFAGYRLLLALVLAWKMMD